MRAHLSRPMRSGLPLAVLTAISTTVLACGDPTRPARAIPCNFRPVRLRTCRGTAGATGHLDGRMRSDDVQRGDRSRNLRGAGCRLIDRLRRAREGAGDDDAAARRRPSAAARSRSRSSLPLPRTAYSGVHCRSEWLFRQHDGSAGMHPAGYQRLSSRRVEPTRRWWAQRVSSGSCAACIRGCERQFMHIEGEPMGRPMVEPGSSRERMRLQVQW